MITGVYLLAFYNNIQSEFSDLFFLQILFKKKFCYTFILIII